MGPRSCISGCYQPNYILSKKEIKNNQALTCKWIEIITRISLWISTVWQTYESNDRITGFFGLKGNFVSAHGLCWICGVPIVDEMDAHLPGVDHGLVSMGGEVVDEVEDNE